MPRITFTQNRTVNDGSGTTFEAGQTYDLPAASCDRWIKRGAATYVDGSGPGHPSKIVRRARTNLNQMSVNIGGDGETAEIAIPEGWADLAWVDLLALAKQLDPEVRSKDDAIAAIELEVERRKAQ